MGQISPTTPSSPSFSSFFLFFRKWWAYFLESYDMWEVTISHVIHIWCSISVMAYGGLTYDICLLDLCLVHDIMWHIVIRWPMRSFKCHVVIIVWYILRNVLWEVTRLVWWAAHTLRQVTGIIWWVTKVLASFMWHMSSAEWQVICVLHLFGIWNMVDLK